MCDVTVVISTFPGREQMLERAVASAKAQTVPCELAVYEDVDGAGGATARNMAMAGLKTEWLAFLDDDDELYSDHVEKLLGHAEATGADLVYPWFDGHNSNGVLMVPVDRKLVSPLGVEFGIEHAQHLQQANFIPIAVLVRRKLVEKVGGFPTEPDEMPDSYGVCYDWGLWLRLLEAGAKFVHLPEQTWCWHVHGGNTSGRSWKVAR